MLIIPAIDLLDGKCVRLYKGDYSKVTVYSDDPVAMARGFVASGAKRIHLVDLDAARGGANNRSVIAKICREVDALFELGEDGELDREKVDQAVAAVPALIGIPTGESIRQKEEELAKKNQEFINSLGLHNKEE